MIEEGQWFVEEAGTYLGLDVPDEGTLTIYLYRWRWDLWRHLGKVCPKLRWRRAACCEDASGYMIGLSGNPDSPILVRNLRHELIHYLLASHFSDFPPWIDEGLAQVMARGPAFPSLGSGDKEEIADMLGDISVCGLRDLISVAPGETLSNTQYHLAWAWTYVLLTTVPDGKEKIIGYLNETRTNMDQEKLFAQIWGSSLEEMVGAIKTTLPRHR